MTKAYMILSIIFAPAIILGMQPSDKPNPAVVRKALIHQMSECLQSSAQALESELGRIENLDDHFAILELDKDHLTTLTYSQAEHAIQEQCTKKTRSLHRTYELNDWTSKIKNICEKAAKDAKKDLQFLEKPLNQ